MRLEIFTNDRPIEQGPVTLDNVEFLETNATFLCVTNVEKEGRVTRFYPVGKIEFVKGMEEEDGDLLTMEGSNVLN